MTVPQRNKWVPSIWSGGAFSFTSGHLQAPIQMQHLIKKVSHKTYHLHFLVSFLTKGHKLSFICIWWVKFCFQHHRQTEIELDDQNKVNLSYHTVFRIKTSLKASWPVAGLYSCLPTLLFPWLPRRDAECYYLHAEMKPSPRSQWARRGTYIQTTRGSPCPQ